VYLVPSPRRIVAGMAQDPSEDEKVDEAVEDTPSDVEEMQDRSDELGERIEKVASDWHSKQQDDAVPGAQPSQDEEEAHPPSEPT
jgi:tetrahydromethanopterin S-methyltransferase subunit G